jgi:glutamate synthase (NADPH/NADH) small chain
VRVEWFTDTDGRRKMRDVPDSVFEIPADLVLIAMGFLGPEKNPLLDGLGVELDERSNVKVADWQTSVESVFACGDARRGQSLVVWAIWEGRECAHAVDEFLTGTSKLPSTPQLL